MSVELVKGDLVTANVDAIVNAANPTMLGGGGVDGAIHHAAGPELLEECLKVEQINGMRCPFGEARLTRGGNLSCKYVIHTVGPIYHNEDNPQIVLANAYTNCLKLAAEYSCKSIAFPAISCGIYGYPAHEAAHIALRICLSELYKNLSIFIYLHDSNMFDTWNQIYQRSLG